MLNEIIKIKKGMYDYQRKYCPNISKWPWFSYRKFKAKFYTNAGAIFVYFCNKLKIKPNSISFLYVIMGIFGGVFLAIPSKVSILLAICCFYFRGILDWSDGTLARLINQTSVTGAILDYFGAQAGWVALWTGMGIYLGHANPIFYYLAPIIPAFFALDLYAVARQAYIYEHILQKEKKKIEDSAVTTDDHKSMIRKLKNNVDKIFEHNARTVDIICLLILMELVFSIFILWVVYFAYLAWQTMIFVTRLYLLVRGGWAEKELANLIRVLNTKV